MEKPLTEEQYHRLQKMGAIVPFDPSSLKYNIYIYVSLDDKDLLKRVKESFSCKDYGMEVSEAEVQKHMSKVKKTYAFNIGDTVLYRTRFKKLPFKVIAINETQATIQCKLRTLTFELEADVGLLFTPDDEGYTEINLPLLQATDSMLIVDFDTYFDIDDSDIHSCFLDLLRMLLVVKTLFPKRRVIFSNPDAVNAYFASILGFTVVYGNIEAYINNRSCIFLSDSPHHLAYSDGIIFPWDLHNLIMREQWEHKFQTTVDIAYSYVMHRPKHNYLVHNPKPFTRDDNFVYHSNIANINVDAIKNLLNKSNGYRYLFTVEKQLRILNG
jgi:hypothetical protein